MISTQKEHEQESRRQGEARIGRGRFPKYILKPLLFLFRFYFSMKGNNFLVTSMLFLSLLNKRTYAIDDLHRVRAILCSQWPDSRTILQHTKNTK